MRRALIAMGMGLSLLGSTVVAGPARAASPLAVPLASTVTAAQQVASFWLADGAANLRNATPYTVETETGGERLSADIVPDGPPASIPPLEGPASPEGETPPTSGKVFFIGSDLLPHWCTGTVVHAKFRNVVATAGHCVLDVEAPMGALWKWVFVPGGHSDGTTPFGLYVGKRAYTHYDLDDLRDYDRDYAFVNVYDGVVSASPDALSDVGRLGDNVGGQGIEANQPLPSTVDVLGYPAGPHPDGSLPYTGGTLERSTGAAFAAKVTMFRMDRPVGVDSPFTGEGSLGSSWLTQYSDDSRKGYLNGITVSVSDTDGDGRYDTGISPYFDGELYGVYLKATAYWTGSII
ncbi:trypsin-like serine peptidase [Sphaerisporangium sp. NPDC004334]